MGSDRTFWQASPSAVRQHSRLLPKDDDFAGPPLYRFGESSARNCMVGRQRDEFLDVGVRLVPQLHAIRQILFISPHEPI